MTHSEQWTKFRFQQLLKIDLQEFWTWPSTSQLNLLHIKFTRISPWREHYPKIEWKLTLMVSFRIRRLLNKNWPKKLSVKLMRFSDSDMLNNESGRRIKNGQNNFWTNYAFQVDNRMNHAAEPTMSHHIYRGGPLSRVDLKWNRNWFC